MKGYCPYCYTHLRVDDYVETVKCPVCRERFHPEHLRIPGAPVFPPVALYDQAEVVDMYGPTFADLKARRTPQERRDDRVWAIGCTCLAILAGLFLAAFTLGLLT